MDRKSRILIVNFLGRIQVASKKKHRKVGGKAPRICGILWLLPCSLEAGRVLPSTIHRSRPFSVLHKDYRQRTALKGCSFAWIERQRSWLQVSLAALRLHPRKSMERQVSNYSTLWPCGWKREDSAIYHTLHRSIPPHQIMNDCPPTCFFLNATWVRPRKLTIRILLFPSI